MLIRGAQSEWAEGEETKRRGEVSMRACDRRCIGNVGEDGGCDEEIDLKARQVPSNKSSGRSALEWLRFRRPLCPDCINGEVSAPV